MSPTPPPQPIPPTPPTAPHAPPTPGYREALAELETILAELEGDAVDVDVLAARVRRAAELIALCRRRLTDARVEVETVVTDLDRVDPGEGR